MLHLNDLKNAVLNFDKEFALQRIISFIRNYFSRTKAKCAVLGISGGVDSSTTLAVTVRALGPEKVKCVIMPHTEMTPQEDINDAYELAESLGLRPIEITIDDIVTKVEERLNSAGIEVNRLTRGNLLARSRMILLYAIANTFSGIVVGSSDKSELILGYYTKYGDGGVDIMPLGDLYKTRVRELAKFLGLPEKIALKPSSPRLWPGHKAVDELGADYDIIDAILYALVDLRMPLREVLNIEGLDRELIKSILVRIQNTEHKRRMPLIPKIFGGMTVGIDWRMPQLYEII